MLLRQGFTVSLRRLLVLLTAFGLLPLALLGVWGLHLVGNYQQREQERYLLDLARALSSAVDAELDGAASALEAMARTPAMADGDLRQVYEIARMQAASQPEWLAVILTDDKGAVLFRTNAAFGGPPGVIADPPSLQRAIDTREPLAGRVVIGKGGRAAFPVRVPVTDNAGRQYVLSAVIQPGRMLRVLERQKVPANSVIGIMDSSGAIVARSKGQQRLVGGLPSPSLVALMRGAGQEAVAPTTTLEGAQVVTGFSRTRFGWKVAIGVPPSALGPLQGIVLYAAGLAASLLACAVLATLLSNRIVRAFRSLQQGGAALGAGLPVSVPPSRISEIDDTGSALMAAAGLRDAHEAERSRLLDSLERALADSRSAAKVKDEFLAVLGHELRNPLSPIVASLDLMDLRNEAGSQRERTILRRQANHLKRLVDDLLDVSRITSGKLRIERRPLNLADLVRHVTASFPGVQLDAGAPHELWVHGDESRLTQVLSNLLSNAARFGHKTTRVTLAAENGQARLAVIDDGVGMDQAMLERVFEPFFQAPQPLARHTGGLGLGLAIVRRIVELHGGSVSAHSEGAGKGSRFEVLLPLGAGATAAPDPAPLAMAGQLAVLVVDDNLDAAESTAAVLAHLGHAVRVAGTAVAAVGEVRRQAPDVAILDIGLPDMDGYALATVLRREVPQLRLVALTGYGQRADVTQALGAGFDLHLTKPASLEDLQRALAPAV
ncbi:ATP-binding protein [Massilia sp. 9I]|uniref:hybrid sensor histidine kinase/response regulator n=1 Tax=Massilia sp. 9I TaxID=2653152 RepID=UPI0012EF6C1C|nr:ATP-binding protein [Massilia sp. 9I]VXC62623.1 Periplasmic sensor hybrid histidine kinase [Massilia sp. 9I]